MSCSRLQGTFRRSSWVLLAASLALLFVPLAAHAWSADKTPASPVPSNRWGALEPRAIIGDQTAFDFRRDPSVNEPYWFAVDVENGWVFTATGRGLQVYDARTNPDAPELTAYGYAPDTSGGEWCPSDGSSQRGGLMPCWNHSDQDWFLRDLDAPPGVDNVVAVAGRDQGFSAWNTSNKTSLAVHYQDELTFSQAVYSTTIGGTHYAFSVNSSGVTLFDLSAARNFTRCRRISGQCPSVFKGLLPGVGGGSYIDGVGNFIILGRNFEGFEIWDVSTPTAPVKVMSSAAQHANGVGIWKSGSSHFAAHVGFAGKLFVYDVSCISSGPCAAPPLLAQVPVPGGSAPLLHLTTSASNGTPYVHVGGDDTFSCVPQREYLFKMSDPAHPEDITPQGHPGGYWGWYYEFCDTGFNWVSPRMGKFSGTNFYRAAYGLLDVHELAGAQPPVANFTWSPSDVYPGTLVTFSDTSTGGPNAWSWVFGGGDPGTSTAENPTNVTFSTPGDKTITLQAFNPTADHTETKTLTVLDPAPVVPDYSGTPSPALVCQPVTFTIPVTGPGAVKGQPPLTYSWKVLDASNGLVAGPVSDDNVFTWDTSAVPRPLPGQYRAEVTVTNGQQTPQQAVKASQPVTVVGLPALAFLGAGGAPENDAFAAGTVNFHARSQGATEWSWNYGDGAGYRAYTNDPLLGPDPSFTYTQAHVDAACSGNLPCTFNVRVKIRNCIEAETESAALAVTITQLTPLVAQFSKTGFHACSGDVCFVETGETINFLDQSTGAEKWEYDWNGDGTFEEVSTTGPVLSHVYNTATAAGQTYQPALRVSRGASETDVYTLPQRFQVDPAGPPPTPSISISGPSSGQPDATLSFSASASNCTPSGTWDWNPAGGTLTGSGSSVTIKWSAAGTKNISVTNSGCTGATGSKTVAIGSPPPPPPPPPPPGQMEAKFTYSPVAPKAGEQVAFNGSTSTGSPTSYVWSFGDGSPLVPSASATVNHTYPNAGIYQVTLSIINTNKVCPPAPFCESSTTKQLVVVPSTPPPAASFTTSASCTQDHSLVFCNATAGAPVTFTDTSTGGTVVTRTWDFGDGQTASAAAVTHAFAAPGSYNVSLTVGNEGGTTNVTRTFVVTPALPKAVVLPWIAQTRGALVQSSDLYLHNPGDADLSVVLEFRKRGVPETNPPTASRTIKPHETLYVADVLKELFDKENVAGFINVVTQGNGPVPVITSFNSTFQSDGSKFGQTVPGSTVGAATEAATLGARVQQLVGLNANSEKTFHVGVSNPNEAPATYKLKFFDKLGNKVAESTEIVLARFGQQQFQAKTLATEWGIQDKDDVRVEVETVTGGQLFPYGASVRTASSDPSFVGGGRSSDALVHLVGVFGTTGLNNSLFQTDVVIGNPSDQVVLTDVTFRGVGAAPPTYDTVHVTLQPRETRRIENVLQTLWGISNAVGVLTFASDSPNDVFPTIVGEVYDNANPSKRFGQAMAARAPEQAAGTGQSQYLIGLRQDADYRSTLSFFNAGATFAEYELIYRKLDGTVLSSAASVLLGPGKMRQINPSQHPLPAEGLPNGFSVEVKVKAGAILVSAQVVNNKTNDPAYIGGETR